MNKELVWQAEDNLRERKTEGDLKDLLKTLMAFANSVAPGDTAQIFIGERDDGTVQGVGNADNIQKKVREECNKIYPPIYFRTETYERDGKQCVRVDIKHNGQAPHLGAAWVRRGSESIKATPELYQQMIDLRQSKVFVLLQWLNKEVSIASANPPRKFFVSPVELPTSRWLWVKEGTLKVVNAFWFTVSIPASGQTASRVDASESMERVLLTWDDENQRLKLLMED